jgi:hypothetical protein
MCDSYDVFFLILSALLSGGIAYIITHDIASVYVFGLGGFFAGLVLRSILLFSTQLCLTYFISYLAKLAVSGPLNLFIGLANLGLLIWHQLNLLGKEIIKLISSSWPRGTWQNARRFMLTQWPYLVFTTTWWALWIPGKLYFYNDSMNWFWITLIGSVVPIVCVFNYIDKFAFRQNSLLVALFIVEIGMMVLNMVLCFVTYTQPNFQLIGGQCMVGKPNSFYWQLDDFTPNQVFLILPNRQKIRLVIDPGDHIKGSFHVTFTTKKKALIRLMAMNRKHGRMHDQLFTIGPESDKSKDGMKEFGPINIEI